MQHPAAADHRVDAADGGAVAGHRRQSTGPVSYTHLDVYKRQVLDIAVEREACPMHLAPTSSTVNTLMLGDALAMAVMLSLIHI